MDARYWGWDHDGHWLNEFIYLEKRKTADLLLRSTAGPSCT